MSRLAAVALVSVVGFGCAGNLKYREQFKLEAAAPPKVNLEVSDARPAEQGGKNPRQVGIVKGRAGAPAPLVLEDVGDVLEQVRAATVDALHGAGLEASLDAPAKLKARIVSLWVDGFVGTPPQVEVELYLIGPDGSVLWTKNAKVQDPAEIASYGEANALLNATLKDYAVAANGHFKDEGFQRAVSGQ